MTRKFNIILLFLFNLCLWSCDDDMKIPTLQTLEGTYTTFSTFDGNLKLEVKQVNSEVVQINFLEGSAFGDTQTTLTGPFQSEDCYIFYSDWVPLSQFFPDAAGSHQLFRFEVYASAKYTYSIFLLPIHLYMASLMDG